MAAEPDRENLREFMREFELRAVLERLEEALGESEEVPGAAGSRTDRVELSAGGADDLRRARSRWRSHGGWAAADGEQVVGGSDDRRARVGSPAGR